MPFAHKLISAVLGAVFLLLLHGCMQDRPADREIPWAAPANWEGTLVPLPSSFQNER